MPETQKNVESEAHGGRCLGGDKKACWNLEVVGFEMPAETKLDAENSKF